MVIKKSVPTEEFPSSRTKPDSGTIFYKATEDELKKLIKDGKNNEIVKFIIDNNGVYAINEDKLYGGTITDDGDVYICVTDGKDIQIDGDPVFPEEAIETYSVEDIADYVKPMTEEIAHRYITDYELKPFDIDEIAKKMMEQGYTFLDIVKAASDLEII